MIKKQYLLISLVFAFLLVISCNTNDLTVNNGNAISEATFPVTSADLEIAINGLYSPLQSQGLYGRYLFYMYDYMAGDEVYVGNRGSVDLREFLEYTFTATNNDIYLYWKNAYNGISRANLILDKQDKINAFSEAEISQVDKNDYIGQVKFLRAFYYFLLVERFGDIPLYTTYQGVDISGVARSPKEDVYQLIISDLQDASSLLKLKSAAEAGRATKGTADALLGKVYLYREEYALAKTYFDNIISSGEYTLADNYFDNFENVNENNSESVFEVQFTYGGGGAWTYADWGGQDTGDSELTFRSFEYGALGGWHNNDPSQSLVDEYEVGDARLANFYFEGDTWSGGTVGAIAPAEAPAYWRKYQKSYNQGTDGGGLSDVNHKIIRYADVLLMAAEVENELGNISTAVSLMNQVRDRAGVPNYGTTTMDALYPVTTKEEVLTAIKHERRVELAGEQSRFPDLLRWGMSNNINGFVQGKHELLPIPQKEIDTNSSISSADQNPGY